MHRKGKSGHFGDRFDQIRFPIFLASFREAISETRLSEALLTNIIFPFRSLLFGAERQLAIIGEIKIA